MVWGTNQQERDERLKKVFEIADKNHLKFNKQKCKFNQAEVNYLDHILLENGIAPLPDRIEATVDMPRPENKNEKLSNLEKVVLVGCVLHVIQGRNLYIF